MFCPIICESLHLWGVARCCYELEMDREWTSDTKSSRSWIQRYTEEEHRGFMILQRERRLKEQEKEGPVPSPLNSPPEYEETSPSLESQLAGLRQQYWLHQQELFRIEAEKPRGPAIGQWEMLRRVKNRQGKSIAWEEGMANCAALNGCCGRDCGCCSKPLKEISTPTGSRQEKSEIYGHCTIECPCCIRFRGFYKPDPENTRLPRLGEGFS